MDTSEDDHNHMRRRGGKDSTDTENRPSFLDSDDDDDDEEQEEELSKGKYQRVLRSTNGEDNSANRRGKEKKQMLWDVAAKGKNIKLKEKGNTSRKGLAADNKENNAKRPSSPKDKRNKKSDDGKHVAVSDLTEEDDPTTDKDLDLESQASLKRRKNVRGKRRIPRYHHHQDRKGKQPYGQASILRRIGISEGKDKMIWARRAFFMSTEKIFPGFIRQYEIASSRARDPTGLKLRASVPLKVCLLAHAFFLPFWFIAFLMTQEYASKSLKPLHNYVHTCLTYVSVGTDVLRLYAGFASNDRDDMQLMALYWMATAILQTPMMCFIFATHCFSTSLLPFNVSVDILLGAILVLEIWFGFWQLKSLVSSEISLLHMARRMNTISTLKSRERRYHPKVINDRDREPYVAWSQGSTDSDTTSSSEIGDEQGDSAGKRARPRGARNIKRMKTSKKHTTVESIPPNEVSVTE